MSEYTHIFHECGNGFPGDGEEVVCADMSWGAMLLVVESSSMIHTGRSGEPNYVYCVCREADREWDDLTEDEQDELFHDHHVDPIDADDSDD